MLKGTLLKGKYKALSENMRTDLCLWTGSGVCLPVLSIPINSNVSNATEF